MKGPRIAAKVLRTAHPEISEGMTIIVLPDPLTLQTAPTRGVPGTLKVRRQEESIAVKVMLSPVTIEAETTIVAEQKEHPPILTDLEETITHVLRQLKVHPHVSPGRHLPTTAPTGLLHVAQHLIQASEADLPANR